MPGWKADIIDLVDFAFGRLRARLEGLSDEEYLWEPAPGCWSIRADEHGRMRGDWVQPVWPAPLTTLAWRLGHIINNLCDPRYATWLGLTPAGPPPESLPASASAALAELERAFSVTRGYLESMSDASLGEIMGTVAGPWADNDKGAYVLHMVDELIHHGAEVALLRDLYRASQAPNPVIAALLAGNPTGVDAALEAHPDAVVRARSQRADLLIQACAERRWGAVPLLVEHGFPLALPDGNSALHQAAAGGSIEVVTYLLDQGADIDGRDPMFLATPAAWAEYFGQSEVAAYLASVHSQPA